MLLVFKVRQYICSPYKCSDTTTTPSGIRSLNQRNRPYAASRTCILRIQRTNRQECKCVSGTAELAVQEEGRVIVQFFVPKLDRAGRYLPPVVAVTEPVDFGQN
jgi:hypothetical protein